MFKYIIRRLLLMLIVIAGVTMLTFLLMYLAPGDAAQLIAVARHGPSMGYDEIEEIRASENLDNPIHIQYSNWLGHIIRGDLGVSLITGEPVINEICYRFPATLQLAVISMLLSLLLAIPIGVISAYKKGSWLDNCCMGVALTGVSMPNFWLGTLLILLFAVYLGWLPAFGKSGINSIVLPVITLGFSHAAIIARLIRSNMLDVLGQNYIRTARANGLTDKKIIFKHAFKNALLPSVTVAGLQFAFLLEGSVVVEAIFAWPGIGKLLVDSIFARDFTMIQGCALLIALIFTSLNLAVDISYAYLDPRIRYGVSRKYQ